MQRVDMKGLSFCLLSDEMMHSKSVMSIDGDSGSKQSTRLTTPTSGLIKTVFDPRLGTVTPGVLCSTCSSPAEICNGHTGHITLTTPVISALFLPTIHKVLNCICVACGSLLISLTDEKHASLMKLPPQKRLTDLNNRSLKSRGPCPTCQFQQPLKWILIDGILIRPMWPMCLGSMPTVLPGHVSLLLSLVTPTTARLFGFYEPASSPDSMMIRLFPIPPTMMRPNRSSRLEDDLSVRLRTIIQSNAVLFSTELELNLSIWEDLSEQTTGRPEWKPRHQRNKKVLVPEHLEAYFDLQRQCAGFQDSKYCPKNDLDYGRDLSSVRHRFVATRHRRGRVRANILGKRGDFTARAVASPNTYMYPHEVGVPIQVCRHLTMKERVCRYNFKKLQQLVHQGPDGYPGANYVERNGERFLLPLFKAEYLQVGDIVHRHLQRGDSVIMNRQPSLHRFSMLGYSVVPMACSTFQLHLSVTKAHNLDYDGDEVNLFVAGSIESVAEVQELMAVHRNLFKDGELLIGFVQHACLAVYLLTQDPDLYLSRGDVQQMLSVARYSYACRMDQCGRQSGRSMLQVFLPVYDGTYTVTKTKLNALAATYLSSSGMTSVERSSWIGCLVQFLEEFLIRYGSTLSYQDCVSDRRNTVLIETGISIISRETEEATAVLVSDKLRNAIGSSVYADLSTRASKNLIDIIESGAKGNSSHIVQNVGMVGQQFDVDSNRHAQLASHDVSPAIGRGMVVSSFSDGLGPVEFFHHLMSSRTGLIGTAVSTAETGYCYRRISKCLEDTRVSFDHSVRTATNQLVTLYGGFSTERVYRVSTSVLDETMCSAREWTRVQHTRAMCPQRTSRPYALPFEIKNVQRQRTDCTAVTRDAIFDAVCCLWDRLEAAFHPAHMERVLFEILSSHELLHVHGVCTRGHLMDILAYVEETLCRSLYAPGTPIGLIVSQSFSEPLTQIQLNRFHHSGEGSGLVSGVTRIKEIINCMKDIKTPSMTIVAREGYSFDTDGILSVTLHSLIRCWTTERCGMVTVVLDRVYMMSRYITPRMVSESVGRIHTGMEYTTDLEATTWEIWFPTEGPDASSPLHVRDIVRSLMKSTMLIRGIKNLHDFYMSTVEVGRWVHGTHTTTMEPCMITKGSNLREVCRLPWVDVQHTTTNDLMEIYDVFGIDAVCGSIERSLLHVMSSNSADVDRNYIHIIAHEMCRTGSPCALTFNGLTNSKTSTLKLATFERSLESFVRAACIGHKDDLRGISESVIVGKPVSVGTGGDFELICTDDLACHADIIYTRDLMEDDDEMHASAVRKRKAPRSEQGGQETKRLKPAPDPQRTQAVSPHASGDPLTSSEENPFLDSQRLFVPYT